jgi:hypothetical protein
VNEKIKDLYNWYLNNKHIKGPFVDVTKQVMTVNEILNVVDSQMKIVSIKCTVLNINDSSYDSCIKKMCNYTKIIIKENKFFCHKCDTYEPDYKTIKKINVSFLKKNFIVS